MWKVDDGKAFASVVLGSIWCLFLLQVSCVNNPSCTTVGLATVDSLSVPDSVALRDTLKASVVIRICGTGRDDIVRIDTTYNNQLITIKFFRIFESSGPGCPLHPPCLEHPETLVLTFIAREVGLLTVMVLQRTGSVLVDTVRVY